MALPAETRMGPVHLTVSDLERSLEYYRKVVGLEALEQGAGRASLGADSTELLGLVEEPGAQPSDGYTGLFHFALLVPDRPSLARWLAQAVRDRVPLTGLSDHYVSEAIYLRDPDRHGIEIYADRPRELWEGRVGERMTTGPLDVEDLLGEADGDFDGMPAGTTMGHVHLKVASIPRTVEFYRDVLGFDLVVERVPQAAFLSAGGYHHHLGANTWESAGAPPPPAGSAALRHATVVLPSAETRDEAVRRVADAGQEPEATATGTLVRDPSGNAVVLTATAAPASAQTQ
jgi:catechol 2,3-dioxygenase